ncbi:ScbA/BarX family gamma-butyrolactone biosynthesis protein [Streptomyces sp. NPDC090022]|uniref:ScbA/BarX family gamma-butyrolactone biosynthesis protein n=1 Tax=Streptomyces sp. NPDC090022 TaxID=3365920 RepID=UPI0038043788
MSFGTAMDGTIQRPHDQGARDLARQKAGELVHRTIRSDILLSDWTQTDDDRFTLTLQWPEFHPFHTPLHGRHAPSLIAETIRQAGRLIAHAEYNVPLDHHFLMWDLNYTIEPDLAHTGQDDLPLLVDVTCSAIRRRGIQLTRMTCHMAITRGGRLLATGFGSLTCTSPAAYRRLRGAQLGTVPAPELLDPVAPASVGRTDPANVVLAPTDHPRCWLLRADLSNPTLFARTGDHLPGMVLLEATHQAAIAATAATTGGGFYPTSLSVVYDRYAEYGAPVMIEARPAGAAGDGSHTLHVTGHQQDQRVFFALISGISPSD